VRFDFGRLSVIISRLMPYGDVRLSELVCVRVQQVRQTVKTLNWSIAGNQWPIFLVREVHDFIRSVEPLKCGRCLACRAARRYARLRLCSSRTAGQAMRPIARLSGRFIREPS